MSIPSLTTLLAMLGISLLTSSCFLNPKKKSGGTGGPARYTVITGDIFMNRIGDGTSARISFRTTEKVFCELAHYSQEEGGLPSKAEPKLTSCPNDEGRDDFILRLDDLATDTLYWVKITVYRDKDTKLPKETVLLQEDNNSGPHDPDKPGSNGYTDLYVARLNVPLKTAEVHRHKFEKSKSIAEIKKGLTRKIGCQSGFPTDDSAFRKPESEFALNNLASTSFASDKAAKHNDHAGVRRLEYTGLNIGLDQWKFIYEKGGEDTEVKARSGNLIQSVEMQSKESALLPDAQLADAVDALAIDSGSDLTIKWETDANLLTNSYMQIYIGRAGNPNAIHCTFSAKDKRGTIPRNYIEKLENTKHVVLALLESNQFIATDGWFVATYDWRSGRIERL